MDPEFFIYPTTTNKLQYCECHCLQLSDPDNDSGGVDQWRRSQFTRPLEHLVFQGSVKVCKSSSGCDEGHKKNANLVPK